MAPIYAPTLSLTIKLSNTIYEIFYCEFIVKLKFLLYFGLIKFNSDYSK